MGLKHIASGLSPAWHRYRFKHSRDPRSRVNNPDWRIVEILIGLNGRYGKTYSFASQDKICELLSERTGRRMSRRTLCRHLGGLQHQGYIRRTRRHRFDKVKGRVLGSTLYHVTGRWLRRMQHMVKGFAGHVTAAFPALASTRVTDAAQYAETLLKFLIPAVRKRGYPQGTAPPRA